MEISIASFISSTTPGLCALPLWICLNPGNLCNYLINPCKIYLNLGIFQMMIGGFNVVSHFHKLLRSRLSTGRIQTQTGTTTPLPSAFLVNKRFSTPINTSFILGIIYLLSNVGYLTCSSFRPSWISGSVHKTQGASFVSEIQHMGLPILLPCCQWSKLTDSLSPTMDN